MKKRMAALASFLRRNKVFTKSLSLVLSLVLIFYVIPSTIYIKAAEALDNIGNDAADATDVSVGIDNSINTDSVLDGILFEATELREENVKHFRLSDGNYIAAQYNYPVHYSDENGEWQDIDNTLHDSGAEFSSSDARIKFAKKITGNSSLFTLHDGSSKITLSLIGAEKGTVGEVKNNEDTKTDTELQKMMHLEKLSASVIYRDILDGVDIEYVAHSKNIKENIIVKEKQDSYSYLFELKLNGLTPTLTESGDIELSDDTTGEIKYTIPAPVVFDASGEYAPTALSAYTLTHESGNKYTLTVTVDSAWMNAEERAFPVTVDPAIVGVGSMLVDTYIDGSNSTAKNNAAVTLQASYNKFIYIKSLSMPTISDSAYISNATVTLKTASISGTVEVSAHEVLTNWNLLHNWNLYSSSSKGQISSDAADYQVVDTSGYYSWNITLLAQKWYNSGINYGVALKGMGTIDTVSFYSSEHSNTDNRPTLTVSYRDLKGIEEYFTYSSHSAGIAGSGGVNLANGNLVFSIPTLTATDGIFAYTPTLLYNSYLANKPYVYGNANTAYSASYMPDGFKLNVSETLIEETRLKNATESVTQYIHSDSDGTEHAYIATETAGEYFEEDALGNTIAVEADKIEITDQSHTVKRFLKMSSTPSDSVQSAWYLSEIEDAAGNKLVFTFDTSYRPVSINLRPRNSSTDILLMTFLYSSDGKLCAVYDSGTQNAVVFKYSAAYNGPVVYSGGKYLREVEYCYIDLAPGAAGGTEDVYAYAVQNTAVESITVDSKAEYEYDSSGRLTRANDSSLDLGISYEWSGKRVSRIYESADQQMGKSLDIEYITGATDIYSPGNDGITRTSDDIVTRYVFDTLGRATFCYSTSYDRKEIYGATAGVYDTQQNSKNSLVERSVLGTVNPNLLTNGDFRSCIKSDNVLTITGWTVTANTAIQTSRGIGGDLPTAIALSPTVGSDAYVKQDISLAAGDYNLTVSHQSSYCDSIEGLAQIINADSGAIICSEIIELSKVEEENAFTSFSFSLQAQANITVKIIFSATAAPGSLAYVSVGMVKLESGKTKTDYNLVENAGFDENSFSKWIASSVANASFETDSTSLDRYLKISASGEPDTYVKQDVYTVPFDVLNDPGFSGEFLQNPSYEYIVSGYAKGVGTVPTRPFRLKLDITYYCGENEDDITVTYYYDFNPYCTDWQFVSGTFSLNMDASGNALPSYVCVKSVDLYCEFSDQILGYALFDDISISYKGEARENRNVFYPDGKIKQSINGYYKEYYEYNSDGNISRAANSNGEITDYTYTSLSPDSQEPKNLVSEVKTGTYIRNSSGLGNSYPIDADDPGALITVTYKTSTTYQYNGYGQVISVSTVSLSDSTVFTKEEYTYNENPTSKLFGLITSEEGRTDTEIKYFYEEYSGRMLATVNTGSSYGYVYTYDRMGRLTAVNPVNYSATAGTYTANTSSEQISYTYGTDKLLSAITTRSTEYTFSYDIFGNSESVSIGDRELAGYEYDEYNGKLKKITYGNGYEIEYVYDSKEQLSEVKYNGVVKYRYEYTDDGQVYKLFDDSAERYTVYCYDSESRFVGFREYTSAGGQIISANVTYVDRGFVGSVRYDYIYTPDGTAKDYTKSSYSYLDDGRLQGENITGRGVSLAIQYSYDSLDRLSGVVYNGNGSSFTNTVAYTYSADDTYGESGLVETYTRTVGYNSTSYTYTYDSNGNITRITDEDGDYVSYTYDDLGQLVREYNEFLNEQFRYTYDNAGNITSVWSDSIVSGGGITITSVSDTASPTAIINSGTTVNYTYANTEWGDLLTSYDGTSITYDNIGNPLSYYNGLSYTFTWQGRRLISATKGTNTMSFAYNSDGLRISKTVNGVTTYFIYEGELLIAEYTDTRAIVYIYDVNGSPVGFKCRKSTYAADTWDVYWYGKNLQGDIVAIYSSTGTILATYKYNAWGETTKIYSNGGASTTAAYSNLTYRGYYYDTDLSMYYLQSRYYDPVVCRFINADCQLTTGSDLTGLNLFAYCGNNPVNRIDPTGEAWWHWALGATVVAVAAVATVVTCGGFAAAATAVCMVSSGVAAATTASTIAAGAFIGSATALGTAAFIAAGSSTSIEEFNDQGNWGTVAATAFGGLTGGYHGYTMSKAQATQTVADDDTFLPDSFYSKHAPKQSTPNSSYTNYTYNNYTGKYEKSTAYYDFAGRQNIRIDWTNHGYSNHGNPHVHYTTYNSQYRDGFTIRWD